MLHMLAPRRQPGGSCADVCRPRPRQYCQRHCDWMLHAKYVLQCSTRLHMLALSRLPAGGSADVCCFGPRQFLHRDNRRRASVQLCCLLRSLLQLGHHLLCQGVCLAAVSFWVLPEDSCEVCVWPRVPVNDACCQQHQRQQQHITHWLCQSHLQPLWRWVVQVGSEV